MREKRGDADYDLDVNFLNMEGSVKFFITEADDIIKRVEKLTPSDFLKVP